MRSKLAHPCDRKARTMHIAFTAYSVPSQRFVGTVASPTQTDVEPCAPPRSFICKSVFVEIPQIFVRKDCSCEACFLKGASTLDTSHEARSS